MKKICCLVVVCCFLSCRKEEIKKESLDPTTTDEVAQTPVELGKEIFEGKGNCVACHQAVEKVIGPSLQEIAAIYKSKNADMVTFLKGEGEPIIDPSQYEVMKTNFAITKTMSNKELKALEAYVYSHLK